MNNSHKLILSKKSKKKIAAVQKLNVSFNKKIDKLIDEIAKDNNIEIGSKEYETLWDHMLNETYWTVDYK